MRWADTCGGCADPAAAVTRNNLGGNRHACAADADAIALADLRSDD